MIADLRRALALLDRADRWRWAALVPLALFVAFLEAAGAGAVFLLVRILADPSGSTWPRALAWLPRGATGASPPIVFAALVVLFYLARNAAIVSVEFAQERVVQRTASRLAARLLVRYLHAPYAFHFHRSSSALLHAVRDSVDIVVEQVLAAAVHVASELLVVAGLLVLLAFTAPAETLAAIVAVLVLLVAPVGATRRIYARWGDEEWRIGERMIARLQQSLDAVKPMIVAGRQDYFAARFARQRAALERAKLRRSVANTAIRLGVETVFICAMLLTVVLLVLRGRSGADVVSVLSLFAYAGFRVVPSSNRIILNINLMRFGRAFVDPLVADWTQLDAPSRALTPASDVSPLPPLRHAVVLDRVSYSYDDNRAQALDTITLTIPKGTSLGIVGPTGSGKSTLVDIVLGLLAPTGGRVVVDGVDISDRVRGWQAQIGYVPQEVVIVDDTLRRNIAFGLPDEAIDDGRVAAVAEAARLGNLVAGLPGGLGADVGERGIRLSGGERQRIAIARALYGDPAVLVFDEATSALDQQTEREIADAIDDVRSGRTVLVVAHRLTTVQHCDRIAVLERGRLAALGSYDELMTASELFRALALAAPDSA